MTDILFFKDKDSNNYYLKFNINNQNINLIHLIQFQLFQLLFDLNKDLCEQISTNYINKNEVNLIVIMKHLFEDIGLNQYFCNVNIERIVENSSCIKFIIKTNNEEYNNGYKNLELLLIEHIECKFNIINEHNIMVEICANIEKTVQINMIEKFV